MTSILNIHTNLQDGNIACILLQLAMYSYSSWNSLAFMFECIVIGVFSVWKF